MTHQRQVSVTLAITMAAAAAAAAVAADASAASAEPEFMERLRAAMLDASGGDLSMLGTMTTSDAAGTVSRDVSGHEMLGLLGGLAAAAPRTDGEPRSHPGPTKGFGHPLLASGLFWPFCDYASIFTFYTGTAGSAVTRSLTAGPRGEPVCGGWYGPTEWRLVEMVPPAGAPAACGVAVYMFPHPDGSTMPGPGMRCGATALRAHGQGALVSYQFGSLAFEYFLGGRAAITVS